MAHIEPKAGSISVMEMLEKGLETLAADIYEVAETCVNKADPVMERAYKGALSSSYSPAAHMTATTPAKDNDLGVYSVSRPVGHKMNKKQRTSLHMLAAFYESGVSDHIVKSWHGSGIPYHHPGWIGKNFKRPAPHPFHANAVAAAEAPTTKVVIDTFNEEVNRIINL